MEEYHVRIQRKDRERGSVSYDVFSGTFLVCSGGKFFLRDKRLLDDDEVLQQMAEYHAYTSGRADGIRRNDIESEKIKKRRAAIIGIPHAEQPPGWEDNYLGDTGSRNVRMAQIEKLKAEHGLT